MADLTAYCISGLGADFRIFQNLHIPGVQLKPISWEMPLEGESLPQYAKKLSAQITEENAFLLGVSFGGMLSSEIAKILPLSKTIIISSCKIRQELPVFMRAAGRAGLHKWVPYHLVPKTKSLSRLIFDTRSREEELYLKQMMLKESDMLFVKRAVDMILHWQNREIPKNLIHIHGTKDRLLFPYKIAADHWVQNGGHFMVWNQAPEISRIIHQELFS